MKYLKAQPRPDSDAVSTPTPSKSRTRSTPKPQTAIPAEREPAPGSPEPLATASAPLVLPEGVYWNDHIGLDPKVSRVWPVILGTEILAEQVATLFLECWSADRILAHYPELTPTQLAACLSCESARLCGPWEDGQPTPRPHDSRSS